MNVSLFVRVSSDCEDSSVCVCVLCVIWCYCKMQNFNACMLLLCVCVCVERGMAAVLVAVVSRRPRPAGWHTSPPLRLGVSMAPPWIPLLRNLIISRLTREVINFFKMGIF